MFEKARVVARAFPVASAWLSLAAVATGVLGVAAASAARLPPRPSAAAQHARPIMVNATASGAGPRLQAAVLRSPARQRLAGAATPPRAIDCLTAAVYYEARGESAAGQAAVAQVVLNRTRRPEFPKTVCGVVYQGAAAHACQFSFACESEGRPRESAAWTGARRVAARALSGHVMTEVGRATHFHVNALGGVWGGAMTKVAEVGGHSFYVRAPRHAHVEAAPAEAAPPDVAPPAGDDAAPAAAQPPVETAATS